MLTKTLLFCFCFVGLFSVVILAIPAQFFEHQAEIESSVGIAPEVAEQLSLANLTVYSTGGTDNMIYDYTSLDDAPGAPQYLLTGTTDDFIEIWWGNLVPQGKSLQIRHTIRKTIPWTYFEPHSMELYFSDWTQTEMTSVETYYHFIDETELQYAQDHFDGNVSAFYAKDSTASVSIIFKIHNGTRDATITEAWNNNEVDYALSYDRNWNATSMNGASLLGQLISFSNPDLGVPGLPGIVLNVMIGIPLMVMVILAIIIIVQSVIPFIKGLSEGS